MLRRREIFESVVHRAYAETDPQILARALVEQFADWLPMPAWGLFASNGTGHLSMLAAHGSQPVAETTLAGVAAWVVASDQAFLSADVARDARVGLAEPGTAVGLPLVCDGRTIAALVGCDPQPSARAPRVGVGTRQPLQRVLDLVAIALDHALRLQKAEALSVTDDLTGLYNSRFLKDALFREAKRAVRYGRPLAVLFLDLDGFKNVNDQHGHLCGSRTLVEAGAIPASFLNAHKARLLLLTLLSSGLEVGAIRRVFAQDVY
ncbi:MAG: GGDEF domain-containing protein [Acidobacteria bacterium]|nr:GGDEF domain-containing protein [Acidobacteriota bacterium]